MQSIQHLQAHRRRGFTVVELLVVVAIVAMLISLLMPALGKAKGMSRESQCLSHVRQMGVGALNYHADWNMYCVEPGSAYGVYTNPSVPPERDGYGKTPGTPWGPDVAYGPGDSGMRHGKWMDLIYTYAPNPGAFICPLGSTYYKNHRPDWPGYAINLWVQHMGIYDPNSYLKQGEGRKSIEFKNHSNKIYFGDAGYSYVNIHTGPGEHYTTTYHIGFTFTNRDRTMISNRHRQPKTVVYSDGPSVGPWTVNHSFDWSLRRQYGSPGGSNLFFFDGHAQFKRFHDVVPLTYNADEAKYWAPHR